MGPTSEFDAYVDYDYGAVGPCLFMRFYFLPL